MFSSAVSFCAATKKKKRKKKPNVFLNVFVYDMNAGEWK